MKIVQRNGRTYRLPSILNPFQEEMYLHLIDWKWQHVTTEAGMAHGSSYDAILPAGLADSMPTIYPPAREILKRHLEKFPFKIHKYFNHMASSQAANINLFLPILSSSNASAILKTLKPDFCRLATDRLDGGFQLEYCDGVPGALGDKTPVSGTDADIAIAYYDHKDVLRLWLIEHKLTEAEFTTCGGAKSSGRKEQHDCGVPFAELVEDPSPCYYNDINYYKYWDLTRTHQSFFPNHAEFRGCPFRGGMNQLWRNQLMALAIEHDPAQPYQGATFSVVRHPQNHSLDKTLEEYSRLIGHSPSFTTFTSSDVIAVAKVHGDPDLEDWIRWYCGLYKLDG